MTPTLQALATAVLDGSTNDRVYGAAAAWVDAGCPTMAPEIAAILAHLRDGDTESPAFFAALRAWKVAGCPGVSTVAKGVGDGR